MCDCGQGFAQDRINLVAGCDWKKAYKLVDRNGVDVPFPAGRLYYRIAVGGETVLWEFAISGSEAVLKVESEDVDLIPNRTKYKLIFHPEGEEAGGDPVALGSFTVQQ